NRVGFELRGARLADHQRAADLCVVTVDLRCQLRRYGVAGLETARCRRLHAGDLRAPGGHEHEVVFGAIGLDERLDFGNELELGHARLADLHEVLVTPVGDVRCAPDPFDLLCGLDAPDLLDVQRR